MWTEAQSTYHAYILRYVAEISWAAFQLFTSMQGTIDATGCAGHTWSHNIEVLSFIIMANLRMYSRADGTNQRLHIEEKFAKRLPRCST